MDTETKEMREGREGCGHCGHCWHGRHHWAHIAIKILVAIFIFWCGVQFGELRGMLHGSYGNGYGGYGYGMMSGWTQ
ncbi:MAG: hypothetical protein B7X03_00050 [Parcubacteria group bacterium 21-58-10]|nr:MAG: hypothetical protein B7X03_00050 [Parcubacteria group bacterium 21-58-10]